MNSIERREGAQVLADQDVIERLRVPIEDVAIPLVRRFFESQILQVLARDLVE